MRSLLRRLTTTLSAKANELLDRYEDPCEALDYAYELELEQLRIVQQAIEHVTTAHQHLEFQSAQLEEAAAALEARAREAVTLGREDLAREALVRCSVIKAGIASLSAQGDELADEDDRFSEAARLLESKVEILGARKEAIKASYAITGAKAEIDETVSEIRDEVANVGFAVQRAENKVAELRARARAIDQLSAWSPGSGLCARVR